MSRSNKKIIILGAGIAGLAAYSRLKHCNYDVLILEARDRPGGRIWTNTTMGIPIGCGANWIHGSENNPISVLANKFGAKIAHVNPEKFIMYDKSGCAIPQQDISKFNIRFDAILKSAKKLANAHMDDIPLHDAISMVSKNEFFSPIEKELFEAKHLFFEGYIGEGSDFLSARHWDQEEIWPGENSYVTNSYQSIIEGLSKDSPIHYNTTVTDINIRSSDIEIITNNQDYFADAVIITVPLGVLKNETITFRPPLPSYKIKSIRQLGMGLFNITTIKFPFAFWQKSPHAMFFTQFDKKSIQIFFNYYHFTDIPILSGYHGGERARKIEKMSDAEIIEKTMSNFKQIFGNNIPDPESYINTRWLSDPFSYGSYSHIPVGGCGNDYLSLSKSISNKLFFAGEATCSDYPATTHGAYLSGVREAENIKNLFHQ